MHSLNGTVVAHPFNPSTQQAETVDLCEFDTSLVYRVSARTGSKATEKPCLEKSKKKTCILNCNLKFKSITPHSYKRILKLAVFFSFTEIKDKFP